MANLLLQDTVQSNKSKGEVVWAISEEITAGQTGSNILLPDQAGKADTWMIYLKIASPGEGKVQWTIDENLAEWVDWESGDVVISTSDVLYGPKAVRGVNSSGTINIFVRAY